VDEYQPWADAGDVGVIRGEDGVTSFGRHQGHVHVHDVRMGRRADRDADLSGAFGGQLIDDHRAAPGLVVELARFAVQLGDDPFELGAGLQQFQARR